ncbi:hypothetical protein COU95_03115 [Candidatus Shapirobacteria bacterium CG10_big_fil_rev_8_21_14_0_10_40_9]|uniref:Uncharacterized protein n=1 Tax=Candidatus Shapirobacteria bacterium CG10_big_fil_rev_8_21_14_0_10_40_9 TaxID=1974888 RepID=A0A2M8L340_9BACT|nr:MAG: hypothetical protein COU95_03115 [Candidatus Shapirobacteria bacterium CG10_big_fil_rev_8_21_14_0_10_40_9]
MTRRKNFLPTFLLTILFWLCWIYILLFTAPESNFLLFTFYFLLFLSLFLTFSLIFANSRRGFLLVLGITGVVFLQQIKLLNILNLILLLGILLSFELYFSRH